MFSFLAQASGRTPPPRYGGHGFVVPAINHQLRDCKAPSGVLVNEQKLSYEMQHAHAAHLPGEIDVRGAACPCTAMSSSGEFVCTCAGVSSGRVPN
jgi:hypothetical protein